MVSGYPTSTSIPRVDGLSTDTPVLGRHTLSPYLFIIGAEGLSTLIKQSEQRGELHGNKVCRKALKIIHLLFTDDNMLFFRAEERECRAMHKILTEYERESGEATDFQKSSIFFSRNVSPNSRDLVTSILGVQSHLNTGIWLPQRQTMFANPRMAEQALISSGEGDHNQSGKLGYTLILYEHFSSP